MFYFGRQFSAAGDPARAAAFGGMFRTVNRNITLLWGIGLIYESLLRVALTFVLPIPVFLLVSPLLAIGTTLALFAVEMAYGGRSVRRGAECLPGRVIVSDLASGDAGCALALVVLMVFAVIGLIAAIMLPAKAPQQDATV